MGVTRGADLMYKSIYYYSCVYYTIAVFENELSEGAAGGLKMIRENGLCERTPLAWGTGMTF
jgi:hypothetical protein